MSNSQHFAVRDAVAAPLLQPPALAGGNVQASRSRPLSKDEASAVFVYLDRAQANRAAILNGPIDWPTRVRIECAARATSAQPNAEIAADALAVQVFARLQADPGLGGLCQDFAPEGIAWAQEEYDTSVATCQLVFTATHRTQNQTIAA